jgi:GAF domain-containing protein
MAEAVAVRGTPYDTLLVSLKALLGGENTRLSVLSNAASLLYWSLEDVNWAGFYLRRGETLYLGPFHGQPACVAIPMGKGVCGTAAAARRTLLVPDVEAFPGHIACDAASRSEIVVPLVDGDRLLGVLDVDSPRRERFGEAEREFLEQAAVVILDALRDALPEASSSDVAWS